MPDKRKVLETVNGLSDGDAGKVMDFIESLKQPEATPKPGSVDAVLRAAGTWWMTPQETQRFLKEVEELRHNEDVGRAVPPQY